MFFCDRHIELLFKVKVLMHLYIRTCFCSWTLTLVWFLSANYSSNNRCNQWMVWLSYSLVVDMTIKGLNNTYIYTSIIYHTYISLNLPLRFFYAESTGVCQQMAEVIKYTKYTNPRTSRRKPTNIIDCYKTYLFETTTSSYICRLVVAMGNAS